MGNYIIVGCDLHDENMVLRIARNRDLSEKRTFANSQTGRKRLIELLKKLSAAGGGAEVVLAYEASSQGFGLYDELTDAGFKCFVLAPTRIERSSKDKRHKDDDRDAIGILEILRGHLLAGNELPAIWIPDVETRDDRELVRTRLDIGDKTTILKTQIQTLLKRTKIGQLPKEVKAWTIAFRSWLEGVAANKEVLSNGARMTLGTLLRQLKMLEAERQTLDMSIAELAKTARHENTCKELCKIQGVGMLTAMVFLTEMGDLSRFANRHQIGAYLGLTPSSNESGENNDRKGHITRQGSRRVRKVLCQASWARIRTDKEEGMVYQRIAAKNKKRKKIAVVAIMRRLAVRMWHVALNEQVRREAAAALTVDVLAAAG